MTYPPDALKKIIKTFVEESIDENISLETKGCETAFANSSIFEIESYLVQLRNAYGINERMDTSIVSDHILDNFDDISASAAFRPVDYQYNFLYHLAKEFKHDIDLFTLIDSFILKFKKEFTLADIVITSTGATRCKTNIRFALNGLRDLGLVLSRDANQKRSWGLSMIGLVALLNIRLNMPEAQRWLCYKNPDSLFLLNETNKSAMKMPVNFSCDPVLMDSLRQLEKPGQLYVYLSQQQDIALNEEEKEILQKIIMDYIDFTEHGLVITPNGIKLTQQFTELSKTFQNKLFSIEEGNPKLHRKLYAHFRTNSKTN